MEVGEEGFGALTAEVRGRELGKQHRAVSGRKEPSDRFARERALDDGLKTGPVQQPGNVPTSS